MRRLIIFLLFLVASVWLGMQVMRHPGDLIIIAQPWMMEMPLWFALFTLILFLLVFYILIDSFDRLQFIWFRLKNWLRFRREKKLYNKTQHGLTLMIENRWQKAERLLLAGIQQAVDPLINYLAAAKAAQALGAYDRRDKYIKKAYQVAPDDVVAIGITQAELEIESQQFGKAAVTLERLRQWSPRHPRILKLIESLYLCSYTGNQLEDVQRAWNEMPRNMRKNPDVVCAYVKQLLRFSETKSAEELIRKTLKKHFQPELVRLYGDLPFVNLNRQLVIAGAWLRMYGEKPEILLTLGKLCMRVQLWGKAKDYFERCLALGPNADASLAYGQLLEKLDEPERALTKYREGLASL